MECVFFSTVNVYEGVYISISYKICRASTLPERERKMRVIKLLNRFDYRDINFKVFFKLYYMLLNYLFSIWMPLTIFTLFTYSF